MAHHFGQCNSFTLDFATFSLWILQHFHKILPTPTPLRACVPAIFDWIVSKKYVDFEEDGKGVKFVCSVLIVFATNP
jgi:hypothetical protein